MLCLSALVVAPTRAAEPIPEAPHGFILIDQAPGVWLFKKTFPNGNPDYVQVIDLSRGASLRLLHGQLVEPRPAKGAFGGPDPSMTSRTLNSYFQEAANASPDVFCVTNGGFFYMPEYPTRLAFPLKVAGQVISEGWGRDTYPGQKLILELFQGYADIRELSHNSLYDSSAPDIAGGLTEEANKRGKFAVGRTFFGLGDRDGDGKLETVLTLNTLTATQAAAAATLREFGAQKVIMFDGGGSTQLLCKSGHYIPSERPIPQAIAIIAAPPPQIDMQTLRLPEWPVLLEMEHYPFSLELRNTGTSTWIPGETTFRVAGSLVAGAIEAPLSAPVEPGATATFTQTLAAYSQPGVYPVEIQWGLTHQGKLYSGEPVNLQIVVMPLELADRRAELETQLATWRKTQPDQAADLAAAWLQQHTNLAIQAERQMRLQAQAIGTRLGDALWVPALMLPMMLVVLVLVLRVRSV